MPYQRRDKSETTLKIVIGILVLLLLLMVATGGFVL